MNITFLGDVMLGRLVNEALKNQPPAYPWGNVLATLRAADVRILNLECVLSDRGQPWSATPKVFHFRSDAKNLSVLLEAGIDAVSIANNHALDYEYDAFSDMLELLNSAGITYAGGGHNLAEASRTTIIEKDGKKIGLLAFTDNESTWAASGTRPGIFYVPVDVNDPRATRLFRIINEEKSRVDLLIVSAHWGGNWGYDPPVEQIPFAHALVDAGADIIFGHSAHIVRAIEIYKHRPILYSTGDFIDDYAIDEIERNDESCIFQIEWDGKRVNRLILTPTLIADFQARLASDDRAESIAWKMRNLCRKFGTRAAWDDDEGVLTIDIGVAAEPESKVRHLIEAD